MVHHAWVFGLLLLGGLALAMVPRRSRSKREESIPMQTTSTGGNPV